MLNNSLKVFYFIFIIIFLYFVISIYFSKDNSISIQNKILNSTNESKIDTRNLPYLKNDTKNVITYNSDNLIEKKIKKRKIWDLLK